MTGALSPVHWLIIVGVLLLLFGAKKLPDLARSVGQSARVLRSEMRELSHESGSRTPDAAADQPSHAPLGAAVPATEQVRASQTGS
ncbi:Sec-independent protein translocase subunit TatA [Actinomycetospora sp.]|uniref:Sec-independent protein translocase subunit TatA n=1 Tax=Actinomycetospora sp. TaxID=1872135 RepID=UPI002F410199